MLEGWREKLPLSPPHMEGEGRKGKTRKGRKAMPCPALPCSNLGVYRGCYILLSCAILLL